MSSEPELADFILEHVIDWDETRTRVVKKKKPIGVCAPTVDSRHHVRTPRVIYIVARVNRTEKEELWDLYRECAWHLLKDRGGVNVDYVWMEEVRFRWDNRLGCGDRPWVGNLGLVCSTT